MSALSRPEWVYPIPAADALDMAKQSGAYGLEKTRYFIEHEGHTIEGDQYHNSAEGLYTVEADLSQRPRWCTCQSGSAMRSPATAHGITKVLQKMVGQLKRHQFNLAL